MRRLPCGHSSSQTANRNVLVHQQDQSWKTISFNKTVACLFDEDLPQTGLTAGVVLQVEFVETVEDVLVGVHVQCIHVQVVPATSAKHHVSTLTR